VRGERGCGGRSRKTSYPKDHPEQAFPELKIYDAEDCPYHKAREDWAGAKRRVADDPAWAVWPGEEKAVVERLDGEAPRPRRMDRWLV
jgi:hypothetical protein